MACGVLLLAACGTRPPTPDAAVTGMAVVRERVVLPPDAVLQATLLDVSDPDAPPVVLGRQVQQPAGQPPFALQIPYLSARWAPKGHYEVRVAVFLNDRLVLSTQARHPVPAEPAFRRVSVQLHRQIPHPATLDAAVPLLLTHWQLREIAGEPVAPLPGGVAAPHLVLQAEPAQAAGWAGCNRFLADYALEGGRLRFANLTSNITLCLQSATLETRFLSALGAVEGFRQRFTELVLHSADGDPLLRFEAAEGPPR